MNAPGRVWVVVAVGHTGRPDVATFSTQELAEGYAKRCIGFKTTVVGSPVDYYAPFDREATV